MRPYIFPITPNAKAPPLGPWKDISSADPATLMAWKRKHPGCNWGLDCGKSGIAVIDIDTKEGKVGAQSLAELEAKYGKLPETRMAKTWSGGLHYLYKGVIKSTASALGKDIDTRGTGGFIVYPPSTIEGKKYEWINRATEIAPLPDWLAELAGNATRPRAAAAFIEGPQTIPAAFAALPKESLSEGIGYDETPLAVLPIMKGCAFLRNALRTHGKDYGQPMWNLTTLAATFMENGHALAHKMGSAHPDYTPESTEALWERKLRERADRGLGWPSCKAIQASGCGDCAACPHFAAGKSPLNLAGAGRVADVPFTSAPPPPTTRNTIYDDMGREVELPENYVVNEEGVICVVEERRGKNGALLGSTVVPIFHSTISVPWISRTGQDLTLNFITSSDKGRTQKVSIKTEQIYNGQAMWALLQKQSVLPDPKYRATCERFLMAFVNKLQNAKSALVNTSFGWWYGEDRKRHGFVYGGTVFKDDETTHPAGSVGALGEVYTPVGDKQPWITACKMVTDQKRPELDAIIAASFAAPLMVMTGEYSGLLSAWGASGAGKSTAIKVGQAVWGHPKKTKEVTMSTARSVVHKMGIIKSLPLYWDEIRDKEVQKNVFDVFFAGTEGVGPSRLTSNIELRERGDWQTMLVTCSNLSFVDFVVSQQQTTDAGIYRVLEYELTDPASDGPGRIEPMEASRITQELEHNYGAVGLEYAQFLGMHPAAVDEMTRQISSAFGAEIQQRGPERFWVAICGALITGAKLANALGATIDEDGLRSFLVTTFLANRVRRENEATAGGTTVNTEEVLTGFLRDKNGFSLFTDTFPQGKGKPSAVLALNAPQLSGGKGICVQWAVKDRILRFSKSEFNSYLKWKNIPPASVMRGLREHFNATAPRASLGASTPWRQGKESLISLPISEGSDLEQMMLAHSTQVHGEPAGALLQATSQQTPPPSQPG